MTKKIPLTDLCILLTALAFLLCAALKFYFEKEARESLGGDVAVSRQNQPADLRIFTLMSMSARKQSHIKTVETTARAQETEERAESKPLPIRLKVIDRAYPIYGTLDLKNKVRPLVFASYAMGRLQGAAVSSNLLDRLSLSPGEHFLIGKTTFLITAVIAGEPDVASYEEDMPTVIISDRAFDVLMKDGMYLEKPVTYEVRAKLNPKEDPASWQQSFDSIFAGSGWTAELWTNRVPSFLLHIKMPFLLVVSGFLVLLAIIRYEMRKRRADV